MFHCHCCAKCVHRQNVKNFACYSSLWGTELNTQLVDIQTKPCQPDPRVHLVNCELTAEISERVNITRARIYTYLLAMCKRLHLNIKLML